jgi:hypothetical protein
VAGLLPPPEAPSSPARWSLVHVLTVPLTVLGVVLQFRALNHVDSYPFVALANAGLLVLARAWPKGWWCTARPARGLLVPLALMTAVYLALHLSLNRPLPVQAWVGGTLVVLACHASALAGSRMRTGGAYTRLRHLARIRHFAAAELQRRNPGLEDAWTSRLQALGLTGEIVRWRERFGGTGSVYTGGVPKPFVGPPGWTGALNVYADSDEDD